MPNQSDASCSPARTLADGSNSFHVSAAAPFPLGKAVSKQDTTHRFISASNLQVLCLQMKIDTVRNFNAVHQHHQLTSIPFSHAFVRSRNTSTNSWSASRKPGYPDCRADQPMSERHGSFIGGYTSIASLLENQDAESAQAAWLIEHRCSCQTLSEDSTKSQARRSFDPESYVGVET